MNTKISTIIAGGALLLGMCACSETWNPQVTDEGQALLGSMALEVQEGETIISSSRATTDVDNFLVEIYDSQDAITKQYTYGTMPEIVALPVGEYTLKVASHDVKPAAWDEPLYVGEKTFKIESNKITEIGEVVASFASLKVTIAFTDDLKAEMSDDVTVTVKANENGASLTFTATEERAAFFEVLDGQMTIVATFAGTVSGYEVEQVTTFTDVQAGQHRRITYGIEALPDLPTPSGSVDTSTGIKITTSVDDEDISGNVSGSDTTLDSSDRPGQETEKPDDGNDDGDDDGNDDGNDDDNDDGDAQDAITFTSDYVNLTGVNDSAEFGDSPLKPAVVIINAPGLLENLKVKIDSDNDTFMYTLSDLDFDKEFDLCHPGYLAETIEGLGLPSGDDVHGKNTATFDITSFMAMLAPFPGTHTFTLTVVDQQGNTNNVSLKFKS